MAVPTPDEVLYSLPPAKDGKPRTAVPVAEGLLPETVTLSFSVHHSEKESVTVSGFERAMITRALEEHGGRLETAAEMLGLSRKGLFLKRRRYALD